MRRARLTYPGAFHHCLNRAHGGEKIFAGNRAKASFLDITSEASRKLRIRILAYCLMDNHYHLVVENTSGRMSDFFKLVNGEYGIYYRRHHGGLGYVFQGRYKSTLVQDESYLLMAIAYVLGNPVRAGIVEDFLDYPWSSAGCYFNADAPEWIDREFVESLYHKPKLLAEHVRSWQDPKKKLPVINTELGPILAAEEGIAEMKDRFERRSGRESMERKRRDDFGFEPLARIYQEMERKHDIKMEEVDYSSRWGQRLRRELLLDLRERAGLKYREIAELPEFLDVKMNSLGKMYGEARKWLRRVK